MKTLLLASSIIGGVLAPFPSMAQPSDEFLIGLITAKIDHFRRVEALVPGNVHLQQTLDRHIAILNERLGLLGVSPH